MKQYKSTVKANGVWVEAVVNVQNASHAQKIFQALFGAANTPRMPVQSGH